MTYIAIDDLKVEIGTKKKSLVTRKQVEEALLTSVVFCSVPSHKERYVVRDVRKHLGVTQVKTLEGWKTPVAVWIEV